MNRFLRHRRLLALVAGLMLCGVLLYRAHLTPPSSSPLASSLMLAVYPFQSAWHFTTRQWREWSESYLWLVDTAEENRRLRAEIERLQASVNQMREAASRYEQVLQELQFNRATPTPSVFAEVIGASTDPYTRVWWVNRGSEDGIRAQLPVITSAGVVGRVQVASPFQATIQLVLDQRSAFPALSQRSRARGMIVGTGEGLELRQILPRADVQVGDRIVTSGLSQLFPKGLPVGIVVEVRREEHELFQTAVLEPAVNFSKLESVSILQFEQSLFAQERLDE